MALSEENKRQPGESDAQYVGRAIMTLAETVASVGADMAGQLEAIDGTIHDRLSEAIMDVRDAVRDK